jgi:hypothetical protein
MPDNGHDILFLSFDEGFRGGVFLHELVEDGNGISTLSSYEECTGDEESEGVVSELFLDESEVRGGEWWEWNARDILSWGTLFLRGGR